MTASGSLDIINNKAIRDHIASLISNVEFRNGVTDGILRSTEHHRYIVEESTQYDINKPLQNNTFISGLEIHYDIQDMCKNKKYARAVSAISLTTRERINAYNELLRMYKEFLPMLELELFNRWKVDIK